MTYSGTHFTETEHAPREAVLVDKAWAKSNKNGTHDKRSKDDRQLPVMLYGPFSLDGPGGMREASCSAEIRPAGSWQLR